MPLLECVNVSKTFILGQQKITALQHVNLTIDQGELIVIVGPSGSGKSTLLHLLGALEQPTEGSITMNGQDIQYWNDDKLSHYRNQQLGFVFQDFKLHPYLNSIENVELPLRFGNHTTMPRRAEELLRLVGLQDRLRHKPHELSGGQKQRVAIARALINKPSIVLADEPTGNLDTATGEQIIDLLANINQDFNTTVIIVTHDVAITTRANRIIHLQDGYIVKEVKN